MKTKEVKTIKCPNPYCDDEDGCCACDYSGKVLIEIGDEYEFYGEEIKDLLTDEQLLKAVDNGLIECDDAEIQKRGLSHGHNRYK